MIESPVVDSSRGGPGRERIGAAAPGVLSIVPPTVLLGLHATVYGRWIVDDAAITFAYARSIATGAGPVLQAGAVPVEGYSNPSWLGLLSLGRLLGWFDHGTWFGVPDYVAFPKVLALVFGAGVFAAFHVIARATTRHPVLVTLVAGSVTAEIPSFAIWSFSGLENSLLAFTACALAAVLARAVAAHTLLSPATAAGCGLLAALAALTRPDGLVYVAAYPLAVLLTLRGSRGRAGAVVGSVAAGVAAFAVPTGAYLLWRVATFGSLLPNTALAKSQSLPSLSDLARPVVLVDHVGGWSALLGGVLVVAALLWRCDGRPRAAFAVLLVPFAAAVAAFAVLEPDWMPLFRFATPVWPLGTVTAVVAAARVLPRLGRGPLAAALVVCGAAGVISVSTWVPIARAFGDGPTVPMCVVAQNTGLSFDGYAAVLGLRTGTLLAPDVGGTALTSRLRIVDLAGLTDRRIARFWADDDMAGLRDYVFDDVRPDFITSHSSWSQHTGLVADPRLAAGYVLVSPPSVVPANDEWVRRDLVAGAGRLASVRSYARDVAAPADDRARSQRRESCGDTLRVR